MCDRLVLAAGTFGTSYLLLRNRAGFPGLSTALGTRFSGNGDVLTFLLHARDRSRTRPLDASHGPVITSAIRLSDQHDDPAGTGRGAYLEDGGYPAFVDWLVEAADVPGDTRRLAQFVLQRFHAMVTRSPDPSLSREISDLCGTDSLAVSSLPLLGMGRDVPDGVLRLRGDQLDLDWTTASSEAYFDRVLADHAPGRGRARRALREQPHVAEQADHHRAPGRRRAHGPRPRRGRVRSVR